MEDNNMFMQVITSGVMNPRIPAELRDCVFYQNHYTEQNPFYVYQSERLHFNRPRHEGQVYKCKYFVDSNQILHFFRRSNDVVKEYQYSVSEIYETALEIIEKNHWGYLMGPRDRNKAKLYLACLPFTNTVSSLGYLSPIMRQNV